MGNANKVRVVGLYSTHTGGFGYFESKHAWAWIKYLAMMSKFVGNAVVHFQFTTVRSLSRPLKSPDNLLFVQEPVQANSQESISDALWRYWCISFTKGQLYGKCFYFITSKDLSIQLFGANFWALSMVSWSTFCMTTWQLQARTFDGRQTMPDGLVIVAVLYIPTKWTPQHHIPLSKNVDKRILQDKK